MRRWLTSILLCGAALLAGCSYLGSVQRGLDKVTGAQARKEKEVAALRTEYDGKIDANTKALTAAQEAQVGALKGQITGGANAFYGQSVVFGTILSPTRTDLVWHNLTEEGWTALNHEPPSYEAMTKINARLKKDLDANLTSLADLAKTHQAALGENQKLSDAAKAVADRLAALEREKAALNETYRKTLDAKQVELVKLANDKAALEKERADMTAHRAAQLAKLSWGAGIIAALCLAGALFSPVFKTELGLAAATFAGAAVAIPFVEGWMLVAGIGVIATALVGWALVKYRREEKVSSALTLAVQDVKEKGGEAWDRLKPALSDRLSRYVTKNGKLVTEQDVALERHIDAKLAEYDALPSKTP